MVNVAGAEAVAKPMTPTKAKTYPALDVKVAVQNLVIAHGAMVQEKSKTAINSAYPTISPSPAQANWVGDLFF